VVIVALITRREDGAQPAVDTLAERTNRPLVALEHDIGVAAQWVGARAGQRGARPVHAAPSGELLSDDDSPARERGAS
jgi:hypothetical protein